MLFCKTNIQDQCILKLDATVDQLLFTHIMKRDMTPHCHILLRKADSVCIFIRWSEEFLSLFMLKVQIAFKAQNIAEYCRIPNQSNEGQSRKIICQINAAVADRN